MKIYRAYNHLWPRPRDTGSSYIRVVSGVPPILQSLTNPFEGKHFPGFKRIESSGRIYYLNGNGQVFLSAMHSQENEEKLYHLYFHPETGILLDLFSEVPVLFKKILYPEWPFTL